MAAKMKMRTSKVQIIADRRTRWVTASVFERQFDRAVIGTHDFRPDFRVGDLIPDFFIHAKIVQPPANISGSAIHAICPPAVVFGAGFEFAERVLEPGVQHF